MSDEEYNTLREKIDRIKNPTKQSKESNMSWVEQVKASIPEHAVDIANDLEMVMSTTFLEPIEAHAVAMVAAICSNNGELAYEIGMGKVLIGTSEREAAKMAAALVTRDTMNSKYAESRGKQGWRAVDSGFSITGYEKQYENGQQDINTCRFHMYILAATVALGCPHTISPYECSLYFDIDKSDAIANIATIISTINRIAF